MAVHRPLMVFRDGRSDRIAMRPQQPPPPQQHPVAAAIAAAGFQTLPPYELQLGEERERLRKSQLHSLRLNPFEDSRMRNLRVYDRQQQQADASVRRRGFRAGRDESGHLELVAKILSDQLECCKMEATAKTLQRVPDIGGESGDNDTGIRSGRAKSSPILTPRRSVIGGIQYLRVGNGNQLVRDPKAASRALANEKVRWNLDNARSRRKESQFCLFFTRFGKCNKERDECPYIHDQEMVAVCTKVLNGNCKADDCPLTHKVIPERMPSCSYFLEGRCTNEDCPYRHVSVNPKAPYCEGFLRGHCKHGDECKNKHTYVCSLYVETGVCPNQKSCKFYHPRKKRKKDRSFTLEVSGRTSGTKRRYFNSGDNTVAVVDGDYISLSPMDSDEDMRAPAKAPVPSFLERPEKLSIIATEAAGSPDEMKKWIRPLFLSKLSSTPAAAAH